MIRDAAQAAGKIQNLIDMLTKASTVLSAAAGVEAQEEALRKDIEAHNMALLKLADQKKASEQDLYRVESAVENARNRQSQVVTEASVQAENIVAAARASASEILLQADAARLDVEREKSELLTVRAEIEKATTELASVRKKIADAKSAALAALS